MLPYRLIFHEGYDLHIGEHVFPAKKYQWLRDRLVRTRFAAAEDFLRPMPAGDDDILLVHDAEWVAKLRSGTLTYQDILRLEIPYSRQMVEAFWLAAGGTILAARRPFLLRLLLELPSSRAARNLHPPLRGRRTGPDGRAPAGAG